VKAAADSSASKTALLALLSFERSQLGRDMPLLVPFANAYIPVSL
jgi:hypothetical protein